MINALPPLISKCLWRSVAWHRRGLARLGSASYRIIQFDGSVCVFIIVYITISSQSKLSLEISSMTHMARLTWAIVHFSFFSCSLISVVVHSHVHSTDANFYGFHSFFVGTHSHFGSSLPFLYSPLFASLLLIKT